MGKSEFTDALTIASKEFIDDVRSKRLILIGLFYLGIGLIVAAGVCYVYMNKWMPLLFITQAPVDIVLSILSMFSIVLVILAIILPSDSVSIEKSSRTMYQLLSKPVSRRSVIVGKYLGSLAVTSILFVASVMLTCLVTILLTGIFPGIDRIGYFALSLVSMLLLFSVYVAIGILISTVTRNPLMSIVVSLVVWVGFLAIDIGAFLLMAFSMVSSATSQVMATTGNTATDAYSTYPWYVKLIMWIDPGSHNVMGQVLSGNLNGPVSGLPIWLNVCILIAYTAIVLLAAVLIFERQDL